MVEIEGDPARGLGARVLPILEGKGLDLKLIEKDDLAQYLDWTQDWDFLGEFWPPVRHRPRYVAEKEFLEPKNPGLEFTRYYVQRKDGGRVGLAFHFWGSQNYNWMEIGYAIAVPERGKGYATETVQILVDFLFLTRQLDRIQAVIDVENRGSQKVVEKVGFSREGELRSAYWTRGDWKNAYMYSITREDWKEPRLFGAK
jgi:RimJ/RimL family protein N-acetyltransferase